MSLSPEKRKEKRLSVLAKFNSKCAYCGCDINIDNFHADHVIPKLRGKWYRYIPLEEKGSDHIDNIFPSCSSCNSSKSVMSIEQFREHIIDRVTRLNNHSSNYQIARRFGLINEISKPIVFYFETLLTNAQ